MASRSSSLMASAFLALLLLSKPVKKETFALHLCDCGVVVERELLWLLAGKGAAAEGWWSLGSKAAAEEEY